jgi:hypothetical protein
MSHRGPFGASKMQRKGPPRFGRGPRGLGELWHTHFQTNKHTHILKYVDVGLVSASKVGKTEFGMHLTDLADKKLKCLQTLDTPKIVLG